MTAQVVGDPVYQAAQEALDAGKPLTDVIDAAITAAAPSLCAYLFATAARIAADYPTGKVAAERLDAIAGTLLDGDPVVLTAAAMLQQSPTVTPADLT